MSRRFTFAVAACAGFFGLVLGLTVTAPAQAAQPRYELKTVTFDGQTYAERWNPCQTITYKVNLGAVRTKSRASVLRDTHGSVRALVKATGIPWSYRGTTGEVPQSSTVGTQSAEVIIAWTKPSRTDLGLRGAYGKAAPLTKYGYEDTGHGLVFIAPVVTRAAVMLNTPSLVPDLPAGPGQGLRRRNVVLHELGHVAGLDHVRYTSQLMYLSNSGRMPKGFAAGDKAGLAKLGAVAGCLAVPAGSDLT